MNSIEAPAFRATAWTVESGMSLADIEREAIRRTLELVGGNRRRAARLLRISESTLYRKLKRYGPSR